jgi:hypothetical protein
MLCVPGEEQHMAYIDEREGYVETTLSELLNAIDQVSGTDEEAFAVLENMLVEGRISILRQQGRWKDVPSVPKRVRDARTASLSPLPPRAA